MALDRLDGPHRAVLRACHAPERQLNDWDVAKTLTFALAEARALHLGYLARPFARSGEARLDTQAHFGRSEALIRCPRGRCATVIQNPRALQLPGLTVASVRAVLFGGMKYVTYRTTGATPSFRSLRTSPMPRL